MTHLFAMVLEEDIFQIKFDGLKSNKTLLHKKSMLLMGILSGVAI